MIMTTIAEMPAGFADKVLAAQTTFRAVMDAMARPGSVQLIRAVSGVPAPKWIKFHTSAPVIADAAASAFAVIADPIKLPEFDRFALGTPEYPDRSTTIVLQVASLSEGPAYELSGPGIDGVTVLRAAIGVPDLIERLAENARRFPRGVDLLLVSGESIVALPRTTRLVAREG
jgi:alpha-D-ribose 1-methylphosphonate 5-triphosphate synthase subunit PhnH